MGNAARRGTVVASACLLLGALALTLVWAASGDGAPTDAPVNAVRFDPGYYYNTGLPVATLVDRLVTHWDAQGVNTVYYYAYSFAYGARYRTRYPYSNQEDFGRLDLLRRLIDEAHRRHIRVIAWVYVLRHKGAWEARPDWRSLRADGSPYTQGFDRYFLSPHNPEAVRWWLGFVEDLLRANPGLDGVDFAEPVVNWWGDLADYSAAARAAFERAYPGATIGSETWRRFRADALSEVLEASAAVVRRHRKDLHITMTLPARRDGSLMAPSTLGRYTGFDLDRILRGAARPNYVNIELIYQQWAAEHQAPEVFTPEWTAAAAAAAEKLIGGRARLIVHLELSEFGGVLPSLPQFARALRALRREGVLAIDLYATHLLDATGAWDIVREAFAPQSSRQPTNTRRRIRSARSEKPHHQMRHSQHDDDRG